jgi:hypothetical protein
MSLQKGLDNRIAKQPVGQISARAAQAASGSSSEVVAALINVRSTPTSERCLAKAPSPKPFTYADTTSCERPFSGLR